MFTRIARISLHDGLVREHVRACFKLPMVNSFTFKNKTIYQRMLSNSTQADGRTGIYIYITYNIEYILVYIYFRVVYTFLLISSKVQRGICYNFHTIRVAMKSIVINQYELECQYCLAWHYYRCARFRSRQIINFGLYTESLHIITVAVSLQISCAMRCLSASNNNNLFLEIS